SYPVKEEKSIPSTGLSYLSLSLIIKKLFLLTMNPLPSLMNLAMWQYGNLAIWRHLKQFPFLSDYNQKRRYSFNIKLKFYCLL
ncbi:hypothetical protein, partial [Bacteroides timonensis]|uniref:hypothetical protein n=1 Tax=Bacteroides timonensis TaxID=1470345 RepID=UPI001ADEE078